MAISYAKPTRSISLPTRLHPNSQKLEAQLNKLKINWESSFSSRETPLGSDSIQSALADLVRLYNSTKDLIQSPSTQQSLLQQSLRKTLEDTLDGSIALLDICGSTRDLIMRMKENAQSLQSSLRRKAVGDSSIEESINAYSSFRKSAKREIAKRAKALKTVHTNAVQAFSASLHEDRSLETAIAVMSELSIVASSIFRSLFTFLSEPATKARPVGWSLISKMVLSKPLDKGHKIFNEVGSVDCSLGSFQARLRKDQATSIDVDALKNRLEALNDCVDGLENELDSLFRCLIQHRVCLLNLLTP